MPPHIHTKYVAQERSVNKRELQGVLLIVFLISFQSHCQQDLVMVSRSPLKGIKYIYKGKVYVLWREKESDCHEIWIEPLGSKAVDLN